MYYNNLISQYGAANVVENGKITGFQFEIFYPNMFGTAISFYEKAEVSADGININPDQILISVDGYQFYEMRETEQYTNVMWLFGERGIIRVKKDGGLESGCHEIEIKLSVRGNAGAMGTFSGIRKLAFV